jgi:phage gp36-like protein
MAVAKTAKEKIRELLSAVHEGGADDKDLQAAIKDATKAVEHLKSFVKKV